MKLGTGPAIRPPKQPATHLHLVARDGSVVGRYPIVGRLVVGEVARFAVEVIGGRAYPREMA